MPFLEIGNDQIYYEIHGSGVPIVLIHGFAFDIRMWEYQKELANSFQLIMIELRGFGRSSIPTEEFAYYHDVKFLLDSLNITKTHIVGLSLGSGVALNFAITYPEACLSLISVSPIMSGYQRKYPQSISEIWKLGSITKEKGSEAFLLSDMFKVIRTLPDFDVIKSMVTDYSGWHWKNRDLSYSVNPPAIQQLSQLTMPVLSVAGSEDMDDFREVAKILSENTSGVCKLMENCSHVPNIESPNKFNKVISDFIASIS